MNKGWIRQNLSFHSIFLSRSYLGRIVHGERSVVVVHIAADKNIIFKDFILVGNDLRFQRVEENDTFHGSINQELLLNQIDAMLHHTLNTDKLVYFLPKDGDCLAPRTCNCWKFPHHSTHLLAESEYLRIFDKVSFLILHLSFKKASIA